MKPGTLLPGRTITTLSSDGRGIVKEDGAVIFVEGGLPGDVADLYIYRNKKKMIEARVQALLSPAAQRVSPHCQHFEACGGCTWQHLDYASEAGWKEQFTLDALRRIGGLELPQHRPILAGQQPWAYRNKVEFSFSDRRWLSRAELAGQDASEAGGDARLAGGLGFHGPGSFDKVVHLERCHLVDDVMNGIRDTVYQLAVDQGLSFHNARTHTGLLRGLLVRKSEAGGTYLVVLILHEPLPDIARGLLMPLLQHYPQVASLGWIHNPKMNDSFGDLEVVPLHGPPGLEEQLGKWRYQVAAASFFQTNTRQAEVLYAAVRSLLPPGPIPVLYDLYCGAGSIGIYMSDLADKIVGVEYVEAAVQDARTNCQLNGLSHLSFEAGDMAKVLNGEFVRRHGRPDVVITDPPRAGMDEKVVQALLKAAPQHIVYVSCNPASQARDLALMKEQYRITEVQPVDMFPHTRHCENIVALERI